MLKNLTKMLTCFGAALVVGLLLMGNADAAQKQKQQKIQNVVWQYGYKMPDTPGPDNFRVLGEFGTKEECVESGLGPEYDADITKENQDLYPGKKLHLECRPDYF